MEKELKEFIDELKQYCMAKGLKHEDGTLEIVDYNTSKEINAWYVIARLQDVLNN